MPNADLHTRVFTSLIKKAAAKFQVTSTETIGKQATEASKEYPTVAVEMVGGGIEVAGADDHAALRSWLATKMISANHKLAPFRDEQATWESIEEAKAAESDLFGSLLPKPAVIWKDPSSDAALGRWARQGFSAHRLEAASAGNAAKPGDRFVVRHDDLHALDVRPGLARYGGDLYLDAAGHPTRLILGGKEITPQMTKEWEFAKFTFRASSLVATTAFDHLGRCHYVVSNALYLASHRHLHLDHPLRHFVSPFHFRTGAINFGAVTSLVPKGGLVHRASGFTWESMATVWKNLTASFRYETLPQELRRRGVHPESFAAGEEDLYPFATDGLAYWNALHAYVTDAFERSPAMQSCLKTGRDETARWWETLSTMPGGLPELSQDTLIDVLTYLFFTVSGFHNFVGTVTEYVADPSFTAGKLWPGTTMADRQSTMQLCLIASTTGFELPTVMGDFSHLMPDAAAQGAALRFRDSMHALQEAITARNAQRVQPFRAFEPAHMSLSVGV